MKTRHRKCPVRRNHHPLAVWIPIGMISFVDMDAILMSFMLLMDV